MVMAPPLASRRRLTKRAAAAPAPLETAWFDPETVGVAYPSPPPSVAPVKRSHRREVIALAAVLLLLLLMGVCAVVNSQVVTLAVDPGITVPGGVVKVTATHVPANQAGEVQLWSVVNTYFFAADANGEMTLEMTVPSDIELGQHVVKICWAGTCHKQAPLRVVSGVAEAPSSTPVANNTPGASPTTSRTPGSTPRPGSTSTPRSTPTSGSTSTPASTPRPTPTRLPSPSPTPTQNPCPGNANNLVLTPFAQTVVGGNVVKFTGANFTPYSAVTVGYRQGSSSTVTPLPSVTASCGGGISVTTPKTSIGVIRTDHVIVCDIKKNCVT